MANCYGVDTLYSAHKSEKGMSFLGWLHKLFGAPDWVPVVPRMKQVFESNRDTFPSVVKEGLLREGIEGSVGDLDVLQSKRALKHLKAWQAVSAGGFIGSMGYIKNQADEFWLALCIAIFEEQEQSSDDILAEAGPYLERYGEALNEETEERTALMIVAEDLTDMILENGNHADRGQLYEAIRVALEGEMSYRFSRIAYFFGDTHTERQFTVD